MRTIVRGPRVRSAQHGFSMLETMLVVILMMGVMTFMVSKQAATNQDIKAQNVADNMQEILGAANKYVLANYGVIVNATGTGTGAADWCRFKTNSGTWGTANSTSKNTCAFDAAWLKEGGYLSQEAKEVNTLAQRWVAIARQTRNASNDLTGNIELLVVGAQQIGSGGSVATAAPVSSIDLASLEKAVVMAGAEAGIVPETTPSGVTPHCQWHATDATQRYVCGAQGAWKAKVSDFAG